MPLRTCIVTNKRLTQTELIRIVRVKASDRCSVGVDSPGKRLFGRSAYIQKDPNLFKVALQKKSIERKLQLGRGLTPSEIQIIQSRFTSPLSIN